MIVIKKGMDVAPADLEDGAVLLVDKASTWTSFDVVNKMRGMLRAYLNVKKLKVGHAGTLDPLATGLLVLCCGPYTKRIASIQDGDKVYEGRLVLGATTASYDSETPIEQRFPIDHIDMNRLSEAAAQFVGRIQQEPPMYSAIKVGGKRLYKLARKGLQVEREKRTVRIDRFSIDKRVDEHVYFTVACSKGTYIRSLVHDLGKALGSGAHMDALRRTRIGDFQVEEALTIEAYQAVFFGSDA